MGREQRIAEKRTKESLERQRREQARQPAGPRPEEAPRPEAAPALPAPATGAGKAILQVVLLYLVPIGLVLLIGKLLFGL